VTIAKSLCIQSHRQITLHTKSSPNHFAYKVIANRENWE
jgi:hypothetical protein